MTDARLAEDIRNAVLNFEKKWTNPAGETIDVMWTTEPPELFISESCPNLKKELLAGEEGPIVDEAESASLRHS